MKYIYPAIAVLIVSVALSFFMACRQSRHEVEAQQKTVEVDDLVTEDIRAIYHLLAKQSSHIRTIMNMSITDSHWETHKDRKPQAECEECLAIYKEIKKQLDEIDREVIEDADKP